ncbi:MAG: hypothetical protein SFZ23_12805 [Planctomycetota bacterium]|nr:hypothetical protein [Planctomycetota bacterium]
MNARPAIIAIVAALAMGLLAWVSLRPPTRTTEGTMLPALPDSAAVHNALVIRWASGQIEFQRDEASNLWLATDARGVWPASSDRVQGALRLLAEHRGLAITPAQTGRDESGRDEPSAVLQLGSTTLELFLPAVGTEGSLRRTDAANQATSETSPEVWLRADRALMALFEPAAVATWLDASVMPGLGEVRRIELGATDTPDPAMVLVRRGRAWTLERPLLAPADGERIASMLTTLARTMLTPEPVAVGPRASTDPESPGASGESGPGSESLRLRVAGEPSLRPQTQLEYTIEISPGGVGGSRVSIFGELGANGSQGQSRTLGPWAGRSEVDLRRVLPQQPGEVASPVALGVPAADIASIEITRSGDSTQTRTYRFELSGWIRVDPAANGTAAGTKPLEEADALRQLVEVLCQRRATRVEIQPGESGQAPGTNGQDFDVVLTPRGAPPGAGLRVRLTRVSEGLRVRLNDGRVLFYMLTLEERARMDEVLRT